ncbi:MAG: hypothetical protein HON70_00270, partial [Lentisphaerae bacterium]|nr:hypothetical protein [Lentisphaerota bacterium]
MVRILGIIVSVAALMPGLPLRAAPAAGVVSADLFVATDGDDSWSGELDKPNARGTDGPFATLSRARDAVRAVRLRAPERDILVLIRGGTYHTTRTIVFGLADSAGPERTITYASYPGEIPVLSAGIPVTGWSKPRTPPEGLPEIARGQVWIADVSELAALREDNAGRDRGKIMTDPPGSIFTLYAGPERLPRARGEGFSLLNSRTELNPSEFSFRKGAIDRTSDILGAELVVIPVRTWVMNILPVEWVDPERQMGRTKYPPTYPLGRAASHRPNAWIENVLAVLDSPGEWVFHRPTGTLYLWPDRDTPGNDIVAPVLTELIRVESTVNHDGPGGAAVTGLVFKGLTFTHGGRFSWHGRTGWGVQHDWEVFDSPTGLVRFRGASRCAVTECRLINSGHTAVRFDLNCQDNRVTGCEIGHVGGCGVLLCGYGPGTRDVNKRNHITGNHIHHVGETYWGSAAIFAWQSGENRIAQNLIHHTPYCGIVVSCRAARTRSKPAECAQTIRWEDVGDSYPKLPWEQRERFMHGRCNMIERNEIHHIMETLGDGNCIYISGTGRGNVVRENYCHDNIGRHTDAAIRTDNDQHDTLIERNIVVRTGGHGTGICNKGGNRVLNNIIADSRPCSAPNGCMAFTNYVPAKSIIRDNVMVLHRKGPAPMAEFGPHPAYAPSEIDNNLYFSSVEPDWAVKHLAALRGISREQTGRIADPMFTDPDNDDFRFRPGSPALEMGISQPMDVTLAGLRSPHRERLLGRPIHTTIAPTGGRLSGPVTITLTSDSRQADIHYTLDGTAPSRRSHRYVRPFVITKPGLVRARSFADGAIDLNEAIAEFTPPPAPIDDDFEDLPVGMTVPEAFTIEENRTMTARVSRDHAVAGRKSLKFIDGPGQRYDFNPHLYYETEFASGQVACRFDLLIDGSTYMYFQWRQYSVAPFARGAYFTIHPGGVLKADGNELAVLPIGEWVSFEI